MVRLKREPSSLAEIEACRAYMWDKVVAAEGTVPQRLRRRSRDALERRLPPAQPVHRQPGRLSQRDFPLADRSWASRPTWRRLELRVVRRTDAAFLEAVETSSDLRTWARVGGLSLAAADGIPPSAELGSAARRSGSSTSTRATRSPSRSPSRLPAGPCRYVRIRGRNFSVAEILGYDGAGRLLDRERLEGHEFPGRDARARAAS